MPKPLKRTVLVLGLLALALAVGCDTGVPPARCVQPTTLIMVRHAEKAAGVSDPPLTDDGQLRAQELAFILENVELDAVYSTDFARTKQTAQPVADAHGLPVRIYVSSDKETFLNSVLINHRGGTVLIVGHSNTIPPLLNTITDSTDHPTLNGYDDLFLVRAEYLGQAKVWPLQYHRPDSD